MISGWNAIGYELEDYYSLFYGFWKLGAPRYDDSIETASVSFDPHGKFINFNYNQSFWESLTDYEKPFIVAHEILHVVLNHGYRGKGMDPTVANIAADVVVNEMLVRHFGFDRAQISIADDMCWLDTVFPNENVAPNKSMEFYYNLLMKDAVIVPEYMFAPIEGIGKDTSGMVSRIMNGSTSPDSTRNVQDLNEIIDKDFHSGAGHSSGKMMSYEPKKMAPNKKWEKLFKKFFKQNTDTPTDQWAMPNRRFTELPDDLILPSEYEQEDKDFDKVSIWLFLDVSGSCIGFKDRFIDIYETIPKKKFKVRLFSFDTNCKEVDTKTKQIYGGGGTSFVPIEQRIQFICRTEKLSYPKLIVVFTDGESFDYVKPEYPERWHWFLMDSNSNFYYPASHQKSLYTSQIPKGSVVYDLSEYESK